MGRERIWIALCAEAFILELGHIPFLCYSQPITYSTNIAIYWLIISSGKIQTVSTSLLQTNQFSKLVIDLRLIVEDKFSGWFIEYQQCHSLCELHRSENKQDIQALVHII